MGKLRGENLKGRYYYRIVGAVALLVLFIIMLYCTKNLFNEAYTYSENEAGISLCINEVMYANVGQQKDVDGDNSDWIEIYNYGAAPINLFGFSIADHIGKESRWRFPDYQLGSGEYIVIWASGKNKIADSMEMHTDFNIDSDEILTLYDSENKCIDEFSINKNVDPGISVGRMPNDPDLVALLSNASPGFVNNAKAISLITKTDSKIKPPVLSKTSGIYDDQFELEITAEDEGCVILYTLDGSEPDKSSLIYKAPILIKDRSEERNTIANTRTTTDYSFRFRWENTYEYKGTVVKARTMKNGVLSSEVVTGSYFISPDTTFDIVSLAVNPDDMFDENNGLYVPGKIAALYEKYDKKKDGKKTYLANYFSDEKVNAKVEIFDKSHNKVADSNVKLSMSGSGSRVYAEKSMKLEMLDNNSGFPSELFSVLPESEVCNNEVL